MQLDQAANPIARPAVGRPLGAAYAWLLNNDQPDEESHMWYKPNYEERLVARMAGRGVFGEEWDALEEFERPKRVGEESEPELDPLPGRNHGFR